MKKIHMLHLAVILLYLLQCRGNSNQTKMEGKVIGGAYVQSHLPHAVCLFSFCSDDDSHSLCGASILNQRFLLTAGHCLHNCLPNNEVLAIAGSKDISNNLAVTRRVVKWKVHSKYCPDTLYHDIAVGMLDKDLPLGPTIKRIIIYPSFPSKAVGIVAGWGVIDLAGNLGKRLKYVKQRVLSARECLSYDNQTLPGVICATTGRSDSYPNRGDSGSSLITDDYQTIGIVSYFISTDPQITYYTNVSYFSAWISETTSRLVC